MISAVNLPDLRHQDKMKTRNKSSERSVQVWTSISDLNQCASVTVALERVAGLQCSSTTARAYLVLLDSTATLLEIPGAQ
jgi:hypothetical protein